MAAPPHAFIEGSQPIPPLSNEPEFILPNGARRGSEPSLHMRRKLQLKLDCSGVHLNQPRRSSASGATSQDSPSGVPDTFAEQYELGEVIGSGTVGTVRRAVRRDGRKVAVKVVTSQDEELRQFTRDEYQLAVSLKHPSIVKMEGLYTRSYCLMICMELCTHGSLETYVSKNGILSEPLAVELFQQLLFGVNYLHLKRIVHRDLKPANLLLQGSLGEISSQPHPHLKITDFNSAKQIGSGPGASVMLSERGTHAFSAPELRFGRIWNERVDIWASGMCFYFMLHAKSPFHNADENHARLLRSGRLPDMTWRDISGLAKNATQQCLTVEMRDRPAAMELMLHPLFYGCDQHTHSKDDMPFGFVIAHSRICGILYLGANQGGKVLFSADDRSALEGRNASLLGYSASQMSPSCWKELRNHSDSLQRLAHTRYERSLAESEKSEGVCNGKRQMEIPNNSGSGVCGVTKFDGQEISCSTSTSSPLSPVSQEEFWQSMSTSQSPKSQKTRTLKARGQKDSRRWFSTHCAVNTIVGS